MRRQFSRNYPLKKNRAKRLNNNKQSFRVPWVNNKHCKTHVIKISEKNLRGKMSEIHPNLVNIFNLQIQEIK